MWTIRLDTCAPTHADYLIAFTMPVLEGAKTERTKMNNTVNSRLLAIGAIAALFLAGCTSDNTADKPASRSAALAADTTAYVAAATGTTVAGVTFYPDQTWTDLGPSGMRAADFCLSAVDGEMDSATVNVFYFGPDQGGGVQDNIARWVGQMELADGSEPSMSTLEVDGMTAHVVQAIGSYNASMGGPMSGNTVAKPNYRMTGVVLEGPQGNVFFKLTGPDRTAAMMTSQFLGMIRAIQKESM